MKNASKHINHTMTAVPRAAAWLGAAGLIPFLAGAIALWALPTADAGLAVDPLIGYGAVILSFMGAVHWGLAMTASGAPGTPRRFALSVLPALLGWCALMLPPLPALSVLAVSFVGVYALDRAAIEAQLAPPWYQQLRAPLTVVVVASLAVGALAAWGRLS